MQRGITFDAGGPEVHGPVRDRPFPLDLVPRVIPASEWTVIKRGPAQRIRALDRFVDDVCHGREIVHDGDTAGSSPPRIVGGMEDDHIQSRIEELEDEERRLRRDEQAAAEAGRDDRVAAARDRLGAIKVELDQLWDLLRQRRALRASGGDPDFAQMRDPGTVERYLG